MAEEGFISLDKSAVFGIRTAVYGRITEKVLINVNINTERMRVQVQRQASTLNYEQVR
jgi:hypothetical protein